VGEVCFEGQEAFRWRAYLKDLSPSQRVGLVHKYITDSHSGATLIECSHSAIDSLDQPLCINFTCEIPHHMTYTGDLLVLKPGHLTEREKYANKSERIHPLVFEYPKKSVDEIQIDVPDGYRIKQIPQSENIDSRFGKFKVKCLERGEFIEHTREFSLIAERIPADMMPYFTKFLDKIASSDQEQVILEKAI
jgi:hypothetical protein